ncbi:hypothetical protein T12_10409 [Trichinella patagoniensis]|uniref:Uncharacterized protein n=1 Tax=Trichinella patagoniensis TaxID=990121 RepID=A0A0V1AAW7_9BILA|nr:hypothetical protein T12_10409 [Trichinella patagoniensis]
MLIAIYHQHHHHRISGCLLITRGSRAGQVGAPSRRNGRPSVGVQGRQNDANELNAHWLSVGFCILFLSVFSILVLFLVCNILHICGFPSTLSHSTRHFTEVDSLPTLARRLCTSPSSNLQLDRYAKKSCNRSRFCSFHALCRGVLSFGHFADDDACAGVGFCLLEDVEKNRVKQQQRPKAGFFQKKLTIGCCWPRGLSRCRRRFFPTHYYYYYLQKSACDSSLFVR